MDQAAHSPHQPPPPRGSRLGSPAIEAGPAGTANLPFAVPEPGEKTPLPRAALIGSLRETIRKIERAAPLGASLAESRARPSAGWRLGCVEADRLLPEGLETDSLHEVKADTSASGAIAGAWMASLGFALRLAVRRVEQVSSESQMSSESKSRSKSQDAPWILWCWPRVLANELGRPSHMGLLRLGLDPSRILFVETPRAAEVLVALEEGLKSGSLALAIGVFHELDLTPARRLSLAAGEKSTPCLAITHPTSLSAAATATRWRLGWAPSARHPFDLKAPGRPRFSLSLERARARPQSANLSPLLLEWSDETHRFGVAASLADRAIATRISQSRARG